ncbi:MAG: glycosyltransferase [Anaerocolumna sp.]
MNFEILIPSYCPNEKIIDLVKVLIHNGMKSITIIDDGSGKEYEAIFNKLASIGCNVLHHPKNRGKGAALKTGIEEIMKRVTMIAYIITADGDGQHAPSDIKKLVESIENSSLSDQTCLWLGVRDFKGKDVPWKSRYGNMFSSLYFRLSTNSTCLDTQTGLRAIPANLFLEALSINGDRYDYEMNFLMKVANQKRKILHFPIQTIYEEGNQGSHFHPIKDSFKIYKTFIKYVLSSASCAIIDIVLFAVFCFLPIETVVTKIIVATVLARICSGIVNFTMNRFWSFESKKRGGKQAIRYSILFVAIMISSSVLVSLGTVFPLPSAFIKIPVDTGLFILSYFVQLKWVFVGEK